MPSAKRILSEALMQIMSMDRVKDFSLGYVPAKPGTYYTIAKQALAAAGMPNPFAPPPAPAATKLRKPRGDSGIMRQCLFDAGLSVSDIDGKIYSEMRKDGTRRLKLWGARAIRQAPDATLKRMYTELTKAFKSRYVEAYWSEGGAAGNSPSSFTVVILEEPVQKR